VYKNLLKLLNSLRKNEKCQVPSGEGEFFDLHCNRTSGRGVRRPHIIVMVHSQLSVTDQTDANSKVDSIIIGLTKIKCLWPQPTRRTSWKLVGNPCWQSGFPTSFQLVRLVGCGLYSCYKPVTKDFFAIAQQWIVRLSSDFCTITWSYDFEVETSNSHKIISGK